MLMGLLKRFIRNDLAELIARMASASGSSASGTISPPISLALIIEAETRDARELRARR